MGQEFRKRASNLAKKIWKQFSSSEAYSTQVKSRVPSITEFQCEVYTKFGDSKLTTQEINKEKRNIFVGKNKRKKFSIN